MRYVLDTDVLVAGLRSHTGASRQLLILLHQRRFQAIASVAMMDEADFLATNYRCLAPEAGAPQSAMSASAARMPDVAERATL